MNQHKVKAWRIRTHATYVLAMERNEYARRARRELPDRARGETAVGQFRHSVPGDAGFVRFITFCVGGVLDFNGDVCGGTR